MDQCSTDRSAYHCLQDRQPWLMALERIHTAQSKYRFSWTDEEVAQILSGLSAESIAYLEKRHLWYPKHIEPRCQQGGSGIPWTERQVRYYRGLRGLHKQRGPREITLANLRESRKRVEVTRQLALLHGWDLLLVEELELRQREIQVLTILRDSPVPMTRMQLAGRLGLVGMRPLRSGPQRRSMLVRMAQAGVLEVAGKVGAQRLYRLGKRLQSTKTRQRTGVEQTEKTLGLIDVGKKKKVDML
jgi:hypothetical protein